MSDGDCGTQAVGHNTVASGQLKSLIERIERLEEERKAVADQVKEVFAEAKGNGFHTKTMRTILRLRKKTPAERAEEEAMLDLYLHALGMQPDLPGIDTPSAEMRRAIEGLTAHGGAVEMTIGGEKTRVERIDGTVQVTVDGKTSRMSAEDAGQAIGAAIHRKLGAGRRRKTGGKGAE